MDHTHCNRIKWACGVLEQIERERKQAKLFNWSTLIDHFLILCSPASDYVYLSCTLVQRLYHLIIIYIVYYVACCFSAIFLRCTSVSNLSKLWGTVMSRFIWYSIDREVLYDQIINIRYIHWEFVLIAGGLVAEQTNKSLRRVCFRLSIYAVT